MVCKIFPNEICESVNGVISDSNVVRTGIRSHYIQHWALNDLDQKRILFIIKLLTENLLHPRKRFTIQIVGNGRILYDLFQ